MARLGAYFLPSRLEMSFGFSALELALLGRLLPILLAWAEQQFLLSHFLSVS